MAWPPLDPNPSYSSTHICSRWPSDPTWNRRHRRRKQSAPSSPLLSILASLVSTSLTNASPTPPSFLCPSIGSKDSIPDWCHGKRSPPLPPVDDPPPPESGRTLRRLPDKFEEGEDGIWRRASYTLYGVTSPNNSCNDPGCQPNGVPFDGTAPSPPPVMIQLPPGWNPSPPSPKSRTTMILAVSLALSLFICILIVICLFWRKGLFSKKQRQDLEAKRGPQENCVADGHKNVEVEKGSKALQKAWARASARWKANAHYSLRQRRGMRFLTKSYRQSLISSPNNSRSRLAISTSRTPSVLSSSHITNDKEVSSVDEQLPDPQRQTVHHTSRFSSPPAYHEGHQMSPPIISSPQEQTMGSNSYPAPSRRLSQTHLTLFPATAHVATDDKTVLSRLADLASAPPNGAEIMSLSEVSAPDDLEFEIRTVSPIPTQISSGPSLFPPPPSKEKLSATEGLAYTFVYDNLENAEPEAEPSAPPFEENPTMQSLPESVLLPSAPPIIDNENRAIPTCLPSAPSLEDM